MKRTIAWVLGVVCLGVGFAALLRAQDQRSKRTAAPSVGTPAAQPSPSPTPSSSESAGSNTGEPAEGRIVYQFEDEAKMREFATLWQQRQNAILSLAVLQKYLKEEQAALARLNTLLAAYQIRDFTKSYVLETARRVLIERSNPQPPPDQPTNQQPLAPSAP